MRLVLSALYKYTYWLTDTVMINRSTETATDYCLCFYYFLFFYPLLFTLHFLSEVASVSFSLKNKKNERMVKLIKKQACWGWWRHQEAPLILHPQSPRGSLPPPFPPSSPFPTLQNNTVWILTGKSGIFAEIQCCQRTVDACSYFQVGTGTEALQICRLQLDKVVW